MLETAWAGGAVLLATHNPADFAGSDIEELVDGRYHAVRRADRRLLIAHTYAAAALVRGEILPDGVNAFWEEVTQIS
ncbi:hypothetical protein P7B02_02445 [Caulobacter segnis]|uniref:hypothetical protein n=1 Tax=Caulobacter segnis TaxID=88688 RepID=UPI00240F9536|nr:hypothetical protein [Caulobacter segnis]MDG2520387.1 hypothetical protein [Caulobacter segnis]